MVPGDRIELSTPGFSPARTDVRRRPQRSAIVFAQAVTRRLASTIISFSGRGSDDTGLGSSPPSCVKRGSSGRDECSSLWAPSGPDAHCDRRHLLRRVDLPRRRLAQRRERNDETGRSQGQLCGSRGLWKGLHPIRVCERALWPGTWQHLRKASPMHPHEEDKPWRARLTSSAAASA